MLSQEKILFNRVMGPADNCRDLYKMVLRGRIAGQAQPGQFVAIRTAAASDPLLRRPLSIAGIDKKAGELTLCYRVKGQGTALLTRFAEETCLDVLGPLGRGFSLAGGEAGDMPEKKVLVAGGIGVFSLYALLEHMLMEPRFKETEITLIWGGEDKAFLARAAADVLYRLPPSNLILCTMDGSAGHKGPVTEPLERLLEEEQRKGGTVKVAACGPRAMLQAVARLCEGYSVPSEVCLEEHMACGLGACLGCTCRLKDETGAVKNGRVCVDGPVFAGKEVVWHERV